MLSRRSLALSLDARRVASRPVPVSLAQKKTPSRGAHVVVTPHRVVSRLLVMADGDDAPKGMFARLGFVRLPHRSPSRAHRRRDAS